MRRKYFIRGMGLGIIITTLIFMGVLFFRGDSGTMTRGEIIQRATELGMVMPDNETMSNTKDEEDAEGEDTKTAENTEEAATEDTTDGMDGENPEDAIPENNQTSMTVENLEGDDVTPPPASTSTTNSPVEDAHNAANNTQANTTPAPSTPATTTPNTQPTTNNGGTKSFTIRGGESSATVGAHLYEQGLVDSASGFDRYLETNGYDKSIHTGTFSIKEGSSYETIAKIITGQ